MARGDGKNWWNVLDGVNCIFALDYNSELDPVTNNMKFTNDSSYNLTPENRVTGKITKELCSGPTGKNWKLDFNDYRTYKSLRLDGINLILDKPISTPDGYTMIVKGIVNDNTVLMRSSLNNGTHGPCLEWTDIQSSNYFVYRYAWRVVDFPTGNKNDIRLRGNFYNVKPITYMIYKGRYASETNKTIITENSTDVGSSYFMTNPNLNYTCIGYNDGTPTYNPKINIIAYGLFDKELSDEEIATVMDKIDEEFLVDTKPIDTSKTLNLNNYNYNYNYIPFDSELRDRNHLKPSRDQNSIVEPNLDQTDLKIKEYATIEDYVYEEDEPTSTKLYLIKRDTGDLVATTYSDTTGFFKFTNIEKTQEYLVVAPHLQYQFKAIVKDYVPDK